MIIGEAETDFAAGRLELAISRYGVVLKEEPENIPALRRQAIAYLMLEKPKYFEASKNLREITKEGLEKSRGTMPKGWSFYKDLALLSYAYMELEQYDSAMEISNAILKVFSDDLLALFVRGFTSYKRYRLEDGENLYLAAEDFEHVVRVGEQIKRKSFFDEYTPDNQYFMKLAIFGSVEALSDIYRLEFRPDKSLFNWFDSWRFKRRLSD